MPSSPNILFILIDDLGWKDLGCYGSTFYETPVLDQLAREGMTFTSAYASCPVCSPSRASIMTGKSPARVGITQWIGGESEGLLNDVPYLHGLPDSETTIAQSLKNAGYQTWHVGKWHLGEDETGPQKFGFDVNIAGSGWGCPYYGFFSPYQMPNLTDGPEGEYLTDRITNEAISLLKQRDKDKPFFMHLSHYAVHTPIQSPKHLVEKYERKAKALGLDKVQAIQTGENFGCTHKMDEHIERRIIQSDPGYAAMVENLDTNIGHVLQALKDEGLEDDTLIVFTSDNGGLSTAETSPTCNFPLREGKGWNEEGGVRVCQIAKWNGHIPAGTFTDTPATSCDYYPTFLELAGLPMQPQQHADGVSLLPLLTKNQEPDRDAIFWHYPHYSNQGGRPAASIIMKEWKLIRYFEDNSSHLYNLKDDISETQNLADQHPELVTKLNSRLDAWLNEVEAKIPTRNPNFPPQN